ncbi:sterol glucosyltransferase [Fusarium albosuccineum]|uniref:Sterol glucosyltransferase n=1 Tax=Fusarium albosuccineum TaxID=1237068 RepID=A0A8H4NZD5_9HYPO|nr:sterol glucosyltransferase [Fusarium albosuccineum]
MDSTTRPMPDMASVINNDDESDGSATPGIDTHARDDGRIDIEIPPRLSRRLSKLPNFKKLDSHPGEASPAYQVHDHRSRTVIGLNIVIQVIGSRGDIQPFVALGKELQKHGHRIRLATHDVFENIIRSSETEFFPVGGDPSELMAYMVKNPGLIPSIDSLRAGDIQNKRKMVAHMLDGFWDSCIQPDPKTGDPFVADAIIANPPSFAHVHCAQALGVPLHMMFTMPWTSTGAFPHPLANINDPNNTGEREIANYLSYGVVEFMTWQGLGDLVNQWREAKLGLEHVPMNEGPRLLKSLEIPFTYCWSPTLIPKPREWGHNISISGFFFRQPPSYQPPNDLDAFLQKGSKPIYVGFGSIVVDDPSRLMTMVLKAIKTAGVRAIISQGWSKLEGDDNPDIFYVGDCPHEWLFQQVSAVVHHGGAGTTACGLLYGRPTVIVPFFGDQPFWGQMVANAGAGPQPIPYSSLTSRNLAEAISFALTPDVTLAARRMSENMKAESGVEAAVEHFHSSLPVESQRCDLFPELPAAWAYKGRKHQVLLSKRAERILTQANALERYKLKFHQRKPVFIESRRWDPFTAVGSASMEVAASMADATAGIFVKPYETIKERRSGSKVSLDSVPSQPRSQTEPAPTAESGTAKTAISTSTKSLGKLAVASTKGILVDIPVAVTDGLRAVPNLYGEDVRSRGHITGFRSGAVVAGKNFYHGIFEALTDIATYTYHGKREQEAIGAAKGLGKGVLSLVTKTTAATIGLVAYPAQGIQKSIRAAVVTSTPKAIEAAMRNEGDWIVKEKPVSEEESRCAVADFETLRNSKPLRNKSG